MNFMSLEDFLNILKFLKNFGQVYTRDNYVVFFGNNNFNPDIISNTNIMSFFVNQVHGKNIVVADKKKRLADGHFSNISNQLLYIRTADCMPAFYYNNGQIVALHIGWRGLEQKILSSSVKLNSIKKGCELFIGPHIKMNSFDLDHVNTKSLLNSHNLKIDEALDKKIIKPSPNKASHYLVSLSAILKEEAMSVGFTKFTESPVNTFTSIDHFSFRRNRHELSRNYSFIIKS
jgi:copper oxidase (laccase) domain-containing protein